jgi:hypothetical protein
LVVREYLGPEVDSSVNAHADVAKAISTHQQTMDLTPEDYANKPGHLNNLGISLFRRFKHSGDPVDNEKAISAHQRAMDLPPEYPAVLNNIKSVSDTWRSLLQKIKLFSELVDSIAEVRYQVD